MFGSQVNAAAPRPGLGDRLVHSPIAAFAPWVIYWVIAQSPSTWLYGALAAALTAIILATSRQTPRVKLLDIVTIVFFAGLTIAGMGFGARDQDWMDNYSTTLSSGVLAVVVLGSLLFVPFTEQYARESTSPDVWNHPMFKHINRVLTLMWGMVFAAIAVGGFIAAKVPSIGNWTIWVIPILLLVAAFRVTQTYPRRVRARRAP